MAYKIEETDYDDMYGKILVGPDNFECCLGEPEDASWFRDGNGAMVRLNEQHEELELLRGILTKNFTYGKGALYAEKHGEKGLMIAVADCPEEDELFRRLFDE